MVTTNNNTKLEIMVGIRLSPEEVQLIDQLAEDDGRTRSGYIRKLISNHVKAVQA